MTKTKHVGILVKNSHSSFSCAVFKVFGQIKLLMD